MRIKRKKKKKIGNSAESGTIDAHLATLRATFHLLRVVRLSCRSSSARTTFLSILGCRDVNRMEIGGMGLGFGLVYLDLGCELRKLHLWNIGAVCVLSRCRHKTCACWGFALVLLRYS